MKGLNKRPNFKNKLWDPVNFNSETKFFIYGLKLNESTVLGSGYFKVKTLLLLQFSAKKTPHGPKAEKILCKTSFCPKDTERSKGGQKQSIL